MDGRRADIYGLVKAMVGADTVIWADQNAPRPASPFWALKLATRRDMGWHEYSQGVSDAGVMTVKGQREEVLMVQRIGAGALDAACSFRDDLMKITARDAWFAKQLTIGDIGNMLDLPFVLDGGEIEPRAAVDITLRYAVRVSDTVGAIETVTTQATYANIVPDGGEGLDQTITIVYTGA